VIDDSGVFVTVLKRAEIDKIGKHLVAEVDILESESIERSGDGIAALIGVEPSNRGIALIDIDVRATKPAAGDKPIQKRLIEGCPVWSDLIGGVGDEVDEAIVDDTGGTVVSIVTCEVPGCGGSLLGGRLLGRQNRVASMRRFAQLSDFPR